MSSEKNSTRMSDMKFCHEMLTIDQIKSFLPQCVFADATKKEVRKTLINMYVHGHHLCR